MSNVLITGSNGFVGQYLAHYLSGAGDDVIRAYRHLPDKISMESKAHFAVGNIDAQTQWQLALTDVDCVVHLAARVHVMQETDADPLAAFRAVNTEGTLNLARQAVAAGVKRFIYLSSIKVNGEQTSDIPFSADDQPNPQDPYAISKFEAEQQLLALGRETGLEVVIIRPPLVYGPAVKGNYSRLIKLVDKSLPLPLAGINNARSLVNIQNLCSLIQTCLLHPEAAGEIFLVSDGQDLSTSELFAQIAQALGKKSRLFYLPSGLIKLLTYMLGRQSEYERLFGSLQVDISKNKQLLDWQPEVSIQSAMLTTVKKRAG
ncbi:MAG: SDR family oxidoreductase [gamma proteobacterium symbiont of Bathyaustriella thionipta]|nr:SDR family oxidoreductase [gamma proteobacterium symbiont of Bathyaustriella thionipta]MCU7949341.1 SDR family oxidoreductase [gamma proteobacterium symbiont of Bathyaustriella thionipta]MCU7952657.1 SDR family oxidoreductase [gamma proteobacterium symbiont of Bathyaustriella thionipta]MCU7955534.1 SDR family oxidoreductase [gamma proteobacterium symbiont of Bathyaustriella thionipta]MCU7968586.1 SDR family oxidoreductase [gamma proteobacterium symbiont of Bathyaustriella thionipta]